MHRYEHIDINTAVMANDNIHNLSHKNKMEINIGC